MGLTEEWRDAPGFEGLYEVSSEGRVRSLDRTLPHARWGQRRWPGRILKPSDNGQTGHLFVRLWKEKKPYKKFVHRLVLEAFEGTCPEGGECLHEDDDPANNCLANLRWGNRSENMLDATRNGRNWNANKARCKRGHPLSGENLYVYPDGRRQCRICSQVSRETYAAKKGRSSPARQEGSDND